MPVRMGSKSFDVNTSFQNGSASKFEFKLPIRLMLVPGNFFTVGSEVEDYCKSGEVIQRYEDIQMDMGESVINVKMDFCFNFEKVNFLLESEALKTMRDIIFWGDERKTEQLQMEATIEGIGAKGTNSSPTPRLACTDLKMQLTSDGMIYEQKNVEFPKDRFLDYYDISNTEIDSAKKQRRSRYFLISLIVSTEALLMLYNTDQKRECGTALFKVGQFAKTGNGSDLIIMAMGEVAIPCYKIFLCANSKVFAAMLNGDFKEKQTCQVDMLGVTPTAVRTMLGYLYSGNVGDMMIASVALELFILADYYDIIDLVRLSMYILIGKGVKWYDTETSLKLYQFAVKYTGESATELKMKALQVLAKKKQSLELSQCPFFKELFPSMEGREMFCNILAEININ